MKDCYAQPCDDIRQVTPEKIEHLSRITEVVTKTILKRAQYNCKTGK